MVIEENIFTTLKAVLIKELKDYEKSSLEPKDINLVKQEYPWELPDFIIIVPHDGYCPYYCPLILSRW